MSRFGVDYSTGPPTIQELKDAKVTFVGRYVSTPGHPQQRARDAKSALA